MHASQGICHAAVCVIDLITYRSFPQDSSNVLSQFYEVKRMND